MADCSPLGREAIAMLNALGMLVDVSHVSKRGDAAGGGGVAHAGCCDPFLRCARCATIRAISMTSSSTRCATWAAPCTSRRSRASCAPTRKPEAVTVADFANHIDYAVRRIGIAHVGISSDFDGGGGFTGWHDAAESPNITAELVRRGYGREEFAALWGGNFLRVLRQAETAAD